jgi:hypothetical protein
MTPIEVEQARKLVRALMAAPDAPKTLVLRVEMGGAKALPARLDASKARSDLGVAAVRAFNALPEEVRWAFYRVETARDDPRSVELQRQWGEEGTAALVRLHRAAREAAAAAAAEQWRQYSDPEDAGVMSEFYEWEQDKPAEPAEESDERKVWLELGGYVPKLAPVVETYLHSTDKDEQIHAFNKLDKYRRKRSDGDYGEAIKTMRVLERVETPPSGTRSGHASKTGRRDPDTVRTALEEWAVSRGTSLEELAATPGPGRPTEAERARLDLLAEAVREMRRREHTQAAIGAAIGYSQQRVAELEQRVR